MDALDRINEALSTASQALDSAARLIAAAPLAPVSQNLQSIGKALVEVFELQYQVYALKPELLPEVLRCPAANQAAAFTTTMARVAAMEKLGAVSTAIGVLDLFIAYQTSQEHLALARAERLRLQNVRAA